jgi:hypothetical protein
VSVIQPHRPSGDDILASVAVDVVDDRLRRPYRALQTLAVVGKLSLAVAEIDLILAVLPGLVNDKSVEGAVAVKIGEGHTTPDKIIELLPVADFAAVSFFLTSILD